jgi:two-component system OmpR family sensor kinase
MSDRPSFVAPGGYLEPIEVAPTGDAIDPNGSSAGLSGSSVPPGAPATPSPWPIPGESLGQLPSAAGDSGANGAPDQGGVQNQPGALDPSSVTGSGDGGARSRRWRFLPRTLTSRLVVGVVALVIMVVVAAGGATYAALGSFLTDRLNQQVGSAAANNLAGNNLRVSLACITVAPSTCQLSVQGPNSTNSTSSGQTLRGVQRMWFDLLDANGNSLPLRSDSPDLVVLNLSSSERAAIVASPTAYRRLSVGGQAVQLTARTITTTAGTYYAVVGLSRDDINNTLQRLLKIELAIGASAALLALLATSIGVRLSLRPLHRVTSTARAVTAELSPEGAGLDRRVPVSEPNTEVGQLAASVNTLLSAVGTQFAARVESEQRMRQFMADASHELRTPLTSIRGYAELARMQRTFEERSGNPDAAIAARASDAEALSRIESEGTRMTRLVDDLLTLARGDTGAPVQSAPVDVSELIDEALEGARAGYPQRPFSTTASPGTMVRGDHDQLLRVLRNLITNAAIHTAPERPIQVTAVRDTGEVVIRVIDGGPGLPPEQAARVFERFWRSDSSRARTSGGSGLGLAIVASIVTAHGGTVHFASTVEAGSVVTITLPAR